MAEPPLREIEALADAGDPAVRDRGRIEPEGRPEGQIPQSVTSAGGAARPSGVVLPQPPASELSQVMPIAAGAEELLVPSGDIPQVQRVVEQAGAVAAPTAPAEAGRHVALQIVAAVKTDGDGGFEVQLSPEELGKVRLSLHVSDGTVALSIHAERPETLDLLRRHIDVLEREFHDAGFTSLSFTFGQGSTDGRRSGPSAYADAVRDRPGEPIQPPDGAKASRPTASTSQLDLRL